MQESGEGAVETEGMATFVHKVGVRKKSLPLNRVLVSKFKKMRAPNFGSLLLMGHDTARFDKKRHSESEK